MSNITVDMKLFCDLTGECIFFKPRRYKDYVIANDNHTMIAIPHRDYSGEELEEHVTDEHFDKRNELFLALIHALEKQEFQTLDLDLGEPVDCDYCKGSGYGAFHDPLEWCSPPINEKDLELKQNEHYFGGMVVALGGDTRCEVCRGTGKYYGRPEGFSAPGPSIRILGLLIDKNLLMRVANQPGIQYALTPTHPFIRERYTSIAFRFGHYHGMLMSLRENDKGGNQ
jgi:hypothetical protein